MISGMTFLAIAVLTATSAQAAVWTEPDGFDFEIVEGCALTTPLTIGNSGATNLNFTVRTRLMSGEISVFETPGGQGATGSQSAQLKAARPAIDLSKTKHKSDQIIVRFRPRGLGVQQSRAEKNKIISSLGGGEIKREFRIVPGLSVVKLPPGQTVEKALSSFNSHSDVLYAEPDCEVRICSTMPNDPRFGELWGMNNTGQTGGKVDADIDAPEAWDIWQGSGEEIVIGVIDTGVDYTHPDLAGNMWKNLAELNGSPGVDDDDNGYIDDIYGYDFVNGDGDPMDDHYHGTHCAGTIGGVGNNSIGVAGVCWNIKIMAIKFLDSGGGGWTSDAIASVEYSVLMGARITSNSWGGGDYDQGLKDAIEAAGEAGCLFVAAAGNNSDNSDEYPMYPAAYDSSNIISVMAVDHTDQKASFSNYGPVSVDLGAPGVDILSCSPGGGYQLLSGTSMATPHVSGACGLLWSFDTSMTNQEVKSILLESVDTTLTGQCVSGGRLNVFNAICLTKVPWITVEPEQGVVGAGSTTDVNVIFDAIELEPGTYNAEILIMTDDPGSPATVPVTMNVNPDALVVSPDEDFESTGSKGGPFTPTSKVYTLTNQGSESVNWEVLGSADWLEVVPSEGVIEAEESIEVTVSITAQAEMLDPNIYSLVLTFKNVDSGSVKPRNVFLTVKPPDMFTDSFDTGGNFRDISLTLRPNGSIAGYEACRDTVNEFPTNPNGGTYLALGDDDYAEVVLADGKEVIFYGESYDRIYVGSNGYITFEDGDTEYNGTLENHFSLPRISGYFTDLTPATSQNISFKQLEDRVAVTFIDVPIFGDKTAKNSFQIEMFFVDGTIRMTWLKLADVAGVAGISEGKGLPPEFFEESDLYGYPICWPLGDYNKDYAVNLEDLSLFVAQWLQDDCGYPMWCDRTDLDYSSIVDGVDYSIFAENWWLVKSTMPPAIAWWKFDEGTGTIAYDSAGDNDGQLVNGPVWATGQINGALSFDGTNDYVLVPNDESQQIKTDQITLSAWIRLSANVGNTQRRIICKQESNLIHWGLAIFGNGYGGSTGNQLVFHDSSGTVFYNCISQTNLSINQWYHVAVTDNAGEIRIYLDGQLNRSDSNGYGIPEQISAPINIGKTNPETDFFFNGIIDDVRFYNAALSAEQIEQIYRDGLSRKASNPNPADGDTGVDPNVALSWSPGKDAVSHDVYFGTDYNEVNDADTDDSDIYMGNQDANSWNTNNYDSNGLEPDTTFYWRIDEISAAITTKGDVWSFTTISEGDVNLASWWKFDEGTGTIAYDSAGDNDGQLVNGPIWTTGKINGGLGFDGVNDYVDCGSGPSNYDNITVSTWMKTSTQGALVSNRDSGGSYGTWFTLFSNLIEIGDNSQGGYRWLTFNTPTLDGSWHHVVYTKDGTNHAIYVDGALDRSFTSNADISQVRPMFIGLRWNRSNSPFWFNGTIDDVRIYDRALSAAEVWQLYQSGL